MGEGITAIVESDPNSVTISSNKLWQQSENQISACSQHNPGACLMHSTPSVPLS
ncbi:hypothetical protein O9929_02980 [Vibrio lentus]|nr:hypothetical protein [Vibrio lentus]